MSHTQQFISASTGKGFSLPSLSETEKAHFYTLMGRAEVAAREYDGTRWQRIKFLSVAQEIRKFAQGDGEHPVSVEEAVDAFARQVRPNDGAGFSLDNLYQKARQRLRGATGQESNFGAVLESMRFCKNKPHTSTVFPVTGKEGVKPAGARYQPKFGALIDELCDHEIALDDISVTTGPYSLPWNLRDSYIVLTISKPALQIAVCDNDSMPTYFSKDLRNAEFWKDEEDTRVVRSSNIDAIVQSLRNQIKGYQPKFQAAAQPPRITHPPVSKPVITPAVTIPHPGISDVFTKPSATTPIESGDLVCRRLFNDILRYALKKDRFPSLQDAQMPLHEQQKWMTHDSWLLQHKNTSLSQFIKTITREEAVKYATVYDGTLPDQTSGHLPGYPDYDFALLDRCYQAYPAKPTLCQIVDHDSTRNAITAALLEKSLTEVPAPPTVYKISLTNIAPHQNRSERDEDKLTVALAYLVQKRKFIYQFDDGSSGGTFIREWIRDKITEYRADHQGCGPTRLSGPVKETPHVDWEMIDDAIYASGRCRKINLEKFVEQNAPRRPYTRKPADTPLTL